MRIDGVRIRTILMVVLAALGYFLFVQWNAAHPKPVREPASVISGASEIPGGTAVVPAVNNSQQPPSPLASPSLVTVETDLLTLKINLEGGDIVYAALKAYPVSADEPNTPFVLMDKSAERFYFAQTGVVSELGPDSPARARPVYTVNASRFEMTDGDLIVPLEWTDAQGVKFTKRYIFHPNNYAVDIVIDVNNRSARAWTGRYFNQMQRQKAASSGGFFSGMQMYQGAAVFTNDKPYKKVSFDDMKGHDLSLSVEGGWVAMMERYFVSAFVQSPGEVYQVYTRALASGAYTVGSMGPQKVIEANQKDVFTAKLYLGPTKPEVLSELAPGLDLTVDYGFLWPIAKVLFWCLKHIQAVVINWGIAIILVTMLIKLIFFRLSASSYRSMAKMKLAQPHLARLKELYGDDRARYSQAVFEYYKKEKMNPMGGCLPMLIPVPVFIALYYMLSESVELRQAPFYGWIIDLSLKDPYYILPILFGIVSFLQQKLSPPPADPVQAKVMAFMPVIFAAMFMQFPAGLVLYWIANGILSMAQQWYITRSIESQGMSSPSVVK